MEGRPAVCPGSGCPPHSYAAQIGAGPRCRVVVVSGRVGFVRYVITFVPACVAYAGPSGRPVKSAPTVGKGSEFRLGRRADVSKGFPPVAEAGVALDPQPAAKIHRAACSEVSISACASRPISRCSLRQSLCRGSVFSLSPFLTGLP